jgi:hypothetical protein
MINEQSIQLGDRVANKINGFAGIVTGTAQYLFGCVQCLVTPEKNKKGETKGSDSTWYDEDSLKVVKRGAFQANEKRAKTRAGGPCHNPPTAR